MEEPSSPVTPIPKPPSMKHLGKRRKKKRKKHSGKLRVDRNMLSGFVEKHLSLYKIKMDELEQLKHKYSGPVLKIDLSESMLDLFCYISSFLSDSVSFINLLLVCKKMNKHFSKAYNNASVHIDFFLCTKPRAKLKYVRKLFIIKDYIIFKRFRFFKLFPNLEYLEIKHQYYFTGEDLKYVKRLKTMKIKSCDLFDGKKITGENYEHIFTSLENLEICQNDLIQNSFISQFRTLRSLKIVKCKNINHKAIRSVTLRKLKVTNCHIKESNFKDLKNLEIAHIKWCGLITGEHIGSLKNLTELVLWNLPNLNDSVFCPSQQSSSPKKKKSRKKKKKKKKETQTHEKVKIYQKHLKKLTLKFCKSLTGNNISYKFPSLEELRLQNNDKLSDNILFSVNGGTLKYLEIIKCNEISNSPFLFVSKTSENSTVEEFENSGIKPFENLVVLKLWGLNKVTEEIFINLRNLESLSIEYCRSIGNLNLKNNVNYYRNLCKLKQLVLKEGFSSNTIKFFSNISDDIFGEYFKNLSVLKLGCTKKISGIGFKYLKNLEILQLLDLDLITDFCFAYLKNLRDLEIKRCKNITFCSKANSEDSKDSPIFKLQKLVNVKTKSCSGIAKEDMRKLKKRIRKNKKEKKKSKKKKRGEKEEVEGEF